MSSRSDAVRDAFIAALSRSDFDVDEKRFNAFKEDVAQALAAAISDRRAKLLALAERARGTLDGVDAAILARVGPEALLALQNGDDDAPHGAGDALLLQLIEIRSEAASDLAAALSVMEDDGPAPARRSRKMKITEEMLLEALARAWVLHIDPKLSLPRRDPNPTSPLLRFLDAMMAHAFGADRPAPKAVLTFLADHIKVEFQTQA